MVAQTRARETGAPRKSEISVQFFARLRFCELKGYHIPQCSKINRCRFVFVGYHALRHEHGIGSRALHFGLARKALVQILGQPEKFR